MKNTTAALILLGLLAGCRAPAPEAEPNVAETAATSDLSSGADTSSLSVEPAPDKVRETKRLSGTFVGFEAGDYLHAVIAKPDGKRESFFLERGMEIFLVDHAKQPLELEVQTVDTDVPEAGGVITIERLHAIRAGGVTFADWWTTAEPSFGKLLDEYQARIEKATLAPEDAPAETSDNS
ncbi:MAG TPA: hypothetical protein VGS22_02205 [Thermoanaerobaculia bacterium]|jgi:hypothetical protein|nr:hypothetical protein [Thermoanaerobaculia bacterium]